MSAFARDRAERLRALAKGAKADEGNLRDLALAEAGRWDTKLQAAAKVPGEAQAEKRFGPRQCPVGTIEQEMVEIPGGDFQMGCSPDDSQCYLNEKEPHQVSVKTFRMGRCEVTRAQWVAVMDANPARFKGDDRPVESVSWNEIQDFLDRLNADGKGRPYRLPSEASARDGV
ncbi:formylglycine-generating enzyme family protein [Candidatus Thiodictyon syntrophicum]|uniref:Sulfatase-modifying factor enzyme-like domain-containing protein n=1 Tax=Candidatus Thiodictyon syntrophicum TaxID=1166950 RepID=A0A2K8UC04_9GAMM|nr:formylglycine-generating enzyme family protein [Candidatus Thiodictyon syntrophicum]AUB83075.1 hypothetical protein THSYN_20415 [Candidatus Thiodictyon syntrophicum]